MKSINFLKALIVCLVITYSSVSIGQDKVPEVYFEVTYMKSLDWGYEDLETKVWKPLHAERVKNKTLGGWYFYKVDYPTGSETMYDYVTVNMYTNKDNMNPNKYTYENLEAVFKAAHPGKDIGETLGQTEKSRKMVWSELYVLAGEAVPGPSEKPAEFIRVNKMRIEGNWDEYFKAEMEGAREAHKISVAAGNLDDWFLLYKMAPLGEKSGHHVVTVDAFGSYENMYKPMSAEAMAKMDGIEWEKLRTMVSGEYWRLLDYTEGN